MRFEFAHAHNVVTLPSHANILSGRYPFDHGVRDNSGFRFPAGHGHPGHAPAQGQGYRTGAFVSAFPLDSRFGLDRGFEVYDDRLGDARRGSDFQMQERAGPETVAAARALDPAQPGPPASAGCTSTSRTRPTPRPSSWRGRVPDALRRRGGGRGRGPRAPPRSPAARRARPTTPSSSSPRDHGEGLGEHGEATHGVFAYESTLRVPLILYDPRLLRAAGRRPTSARHVDIVPTVLDALGLPRPGGAPRPEPARGRRRGSAAPSPSTATSRP